MVTLILQMFHVLSILQYSHSLLFQSDGEEFDERRGMEQVEKTYIGDSKNDADK